MNTHRRELKSEFEDISAEFEASFADGGCSCHISPPCSYCVHPGNPLCLEESDAYIYIPIEGKEHYGTW